MRSSKPKMMAMFFQIQSLGKAQEVLNILGRLIIFYAIIHSLIHTYIMYGALSVDRPPSELDYAFSPLMIILSFLVMETGLLAKGFFILLISCVFGMLSGENVSREDEVKKTLHLTCVFLCLEGLSLIVTYSVKAYSFFFYSRNFPEQYSLVDSRWFWLLNNIAGAVIALAPIFYAMVIYTLFNYFNGLVKFEKEVI